MARRPRLAFDGAALSEARAATRESLLCHPDTPARSVGRVDVEVRQAGEGLELACTIACPTGRLRLPPRADPVRADDLWKTTCLELFVRTGERYLEFNFAPSGQWAAYRFTGYRDGREPLAIESPPAIRAEDRGDALIVTVALPLALPRPARLALSAVVEEVDGTKSFWALAHPPGAPDFHHRDCFVLELPPAS